MNRSIVAVLWSSVSLSSLRPRSAQQPLQPAPDADGQSTVDPLRAATASAAAARMPQQPMDPYAQYGEPDEEDDTMDVTYDISTSARRAGAAVRRRLRSERVPAVRVAARALRHVGRRCRELRPRLGAVDDGRSATTSSRTTRGGHFVVHRLRLDLGQRLRLGLGAVSLRPLERIGGHGWCWMPGTVVGPGLGELALGRRLRRLGADGPARRIVGAPRGVALAVALHRRRAARRGAPALPAVARGGVGVARHARRSTTSRSINVRGATVRFNAGPSARMVAAATGRTLAPTPLHTVAPRALPNRRHHAARRARRSVRVRGCSSAPLGGSLRALGAGLAHARLVAGACRGRARSVDRAAPDRTAIARRADVSRADATQPVYRAPRSRCIARQRTRSRLRAPT